MGHLLTLANGFTGLEELEVAENCELIFATTNLFDVVAIETLVPEVIRIPKFRDPHDLKRRP